MSDSEASTDEFARPRIYDSGTRPIVAAENVAKLEVPNENLFRTAIEKAAVQPEPSTSE